MGILFKLLSYRKNFKFFELLVLKEKKCVSIWEEEVFKFELLDFDSSPFLSVTSDLPDPPPDNEDWSPTGTAPPLST